MWPLVGPQTSWWPTPPAPAFRAAEAQLCLSPVPPTLQAVRGGSTAQRQGEPAWHRRQRRERGNARALLRVAAAARLTSAHHSAQRHVRGWRAAAEDIGLAAAPMPNAGGGKGGKGGSSSGGKGLQQDRNPGTGSGPRQGDWHCTICGTPGNRAWRTRCRNCESYRNKAMAKAMATASQPQPSLAERQLQQQKAAQQNQRREDAEKKKLREANARLVAENAALKERQQEPPAADHDADEDMDEGDEGSYATWSEEARTKRVELAKGGLAYAIDKHGEDSAEAAEFRQEIAMLQKASREAKPFKAHRSQLERRRERLQKQQERDTSEIARAEAEVSELQAKIGTLQTAVEERARAIKDVTTELTELVRKSIEEGSEGENGGGPLGGQEESPWHKVATAIKGLEALPGIPAEVINLLAKVQEAAAAAALSAGASPADPRGGAGGPGQPASGQAAAVAPTPPNAAATVTPVVLAPHGRFSKGAARAAAPSGGGASVGPTAAAAAASAEAAASAGAGSGGGAQAGAGDAGAQGSGTGSAEEAKPGDDAMQVDIESSLAKLPEQDQRTLRAALGRGRDRGKSGAKVEEDEDSSRREERERSPRPTKGGEEKEV